MSAALLNLLFGTACLLFGCATTGSRVLLVLFTTYAPPPQAYPWQGTRTPPPPDVAAWIHEQEPASLIVEVAAALGIVLGGLVLIVASIGLLHMKPWGRWLTALYCLGTIAAQLALAGYRVLVILPLGQRYFATFVPHPSYSYYTTGDAHGFQVGFFLLLALQLSLLVGHALAVLLVLFLPSVNAAFAGKDLAVRATA